MIEKLTVLYGKKNSNQDQTDPRFTKMAGMFEGLDQHFLINLSALDEIQEKVNEL